MAPRFERLVRFRTSSGDIHYGELPVDGTTHLQDLAGWTVQVYGGGTPFEDDFTLSNQREIIHEAGSSLICLKPVLCPIPSTPIFHCVGINYKTHIFEAGYPVTFTKPPDALAGPSEDIPVHPQCQWMDYEAELCAIIAADCKNITDPAEAKSYILGYTAGNDVSSRYWQMPERCGNQHGSAKSFDKFAPLGPTILHPSLVDEGQGLHIRTFVNGDLRQDARTNDLVFDVPSIICHLSRGTTLRKGTVIMTGTPGGVAAFMKPPQWLKDGDVVEVDIERIGRMRNVMRFGTE